WTRGIRLSCSRPEGNGARITWAAPGRGISETKTCVTDGRANSCIPCGCPRGIDPEADLRHIFARMGPVHVKEARYWRHLLGRVASDMEATAMGELDPRRARWF